MRQRLYEGDKHGAVEAVLVAHDPGERGARVSFWLRAKGQRVDFDCSSSEADPIAKRLVTPVDHPGPVDAAALNAMRVLHEYIRTPDKGALERSGTWDRLVAALAEVERLAPEVFK